MIFPLATRELRQASRRARTYWGRCGIAALSILCALAVLSPSFRGIVPPQETGRILFILMAIMAFVCCLLAGAFVTADALSEEKRDGTLPLLFLTKIHSHDIVLGKLLAKSLAGFYSQLGILPVLAIPILLGGVTGGEFWRMSLTLVTTLGFSLCAGMFASAIFCDSQRNWLGAVGLIALFSMAPLLGGDLIGNTGLVINDGIHKFSPFYACYSSFDSAYAANGGKSFWHSIQWMLFLSISFLAGASFLLPRALRERPDSVHAVRLRARWHQWAFGSGEERRREREHWVAINAVLWLAHRGRHLMAALWLAMLVLVSIWAATWWHFRNVAVRPEFLIVAMTLFHLVLKGWLALEVTRRLAEDRKSGALELMLTSPLRVPDILKGLLAAVRRQFVVPFAIVLGLDIFLLGFAFNSGDSTELAIIFLASVGLLMADAYALTWFGLWQGLSASSPAKALTKSLLHVLVMPWLYFSIVMGLLTMAFVQGASDLGGWMAGVWFAVGYLTDAVLCGIGIHKLTLHFRKAASELPGHKPRPAWLLKPLALFKLRRQTPLVLVQSAHEK